jgi:chemotaxis protein MotB
VALAASTFAQDYPQRHPPSTATEELIDSIQARIDRLTKVRSDADAALEFLDRQVAEMINRLSSRQEENYALRQRVIGLSTEIEALATTREELSSQLSRVIGERNSVVDEFEARITELATAFDTTEEALEAALARNAALEAELTAERRRGAGREQELSALRDRHMELEARLTEEKERRVLFQREREMYALALLERAEAAERSYENERGVSETAQRRVAVLHQQLLELRKQLATLNEVLEASEVKNREQQAFIVALGQRLNQALATKLQELTKYRSEFFGRLREVLGERRDVTIVGDRFVIQSGVLFGTASAKLEKEGKALLKTLAKTFFEIAEEIPEDIPWILRVDGHTNVRSIFTPEYPSNWELSMARAMSVVLFLISEGVPPERLTAAGFGEYQPLDPRDDEIAYRRNRRIEFKLTQN